MRISAVFLLVAFCWVSAPNKMVSAVNLVNVALNKPTRQSSTRGPNDSGKSVNGDTNMYMSSTRCSHTYYGENNWWAVDLLAPCPVHSVRVTNRINEKDLRDFSVYVSKTNPLIPPLERNGPRPGKLCFHYPGIFPNRQAETVPCDTVVTGRYLYIWKSFYGKLAMCELEVLVEESKYANYDYSSLLSAQRDNSGSAESSSSNGNGVMYSIRRGWRSQMTSFRQTVIRSPLRSLEFHCIWFCLSRESRHLASVIQFEETSGLCECIEKSNLVDSNPADVESPNWNLLESSTN